MSFLGLIQLSTQKKQWNIPILDLIDFLVINFSHSLIFVHLAMI